MEKKVRNNLMQTNCAKQCLARTRKGLPCQSPVVTGKKRCRMHGGAKGSGAPLGNQNALKHGLYNAKTIRIKREVRALLKENAEILKKI